jgi:hypothetical protein
MHTHTYTQKYAYTRTRTHTYTYTYIFIHIHIQLIHPSSPLTSRVGLVKREEDAGVFQYYIKIVPTDLFSVDGHTVVHTNQYSATEHFRPLHFGGALPGMQSIVNKKTKIFKDLFKYSFRM